MKLLLLMLLAAVSAQGQKKDTASISIHSLVGSGTNTIGAGYYTQIWQWNVTPKYDTIPVLMLVCDTATYSRFDTDAFIGNTIAVYKDGSVVYDPGVIWQFGYEVRSVTSGYLYLTEDGYFKPTYTHHSYLNRGKQPMKSSTVVWMVKEIKK